MSDTAHFKDLGTLNSQIERDYDPLIFLDSLPKKYGDRVRYKSPFGQFHFFNHPSDVQSVMKNTQLVRLPFLKMALGDGLLTSEGAHWHNQRKIATPHFNCTKVLDFIPLIEKQTLETMEDWKGFADRGESVDLSEDMNLLTLHIILWALFGYNLDEKTNKELHSAVSTIMIDMSKLANMAFSSEPLNFSKTRERTFGHALNVVENVVENILNKREKSESTHEDFLSGLMNAKYSDTGEPLSRKHIRDEIVTMMIAGNETTALTLTWTWYLLHKNPESEARLYQELDTIIGDRSPTPEDLRNLEWTTCVVKEAMRFYPPVWSFSRKADSDQMIGDILIKKGESVLVCPYTTHRHPDFWEAPESFRPERFLPSNNKSLDKSAYIPFAGGRHLCLGMHFAMMESVMIVALIGQRFRVRPVSDEPAKIDPGLSLRMKNGYLVYLEPRS